MGFRFQRRAGVLGGLVQFNLSKTGVSISAGPRGLSANMPLVSTRKRRPRITAGIPGTGLSYSEQIGSATQTQLVSDQGSEPRGGNRVTVVMMILLGLVLAFGLLVLAAH